jgi:nitronate monooxygenase
MWPQNALTERLNIRWPILQAPMAAAAVSNAGGLGGLGTWGFSADDAERRIAGFRQQSGGSLNVNYPLWPEPKITAEVTEPMRKRLQAHYDAKGLGPVPKPEGAASDVSPEHLAWYYARSRRSLVSILACPSRRS